MKIQKNAVFPILTVFVTALMLSVPQVFAENASVSIPQGTSVPGCEATDQCYIPYEVTIDVGGVVTWSNDDTAAHTVTAGSAAGGPSGVFDSGLFMAGTTFDHKFEAAGEFPYFCMVHPWMQGVVVVGDAMEKQPKSTVIAVPTTTSTDNKVKITIEHEIVGGKIKNSFADPDTNSVIIEIETSREGQITATLPRDVIDAKIGNEDDDLFVLVDGEEVTYEETKTSTDRTLVIEFPATAEEIEIIGTFAIPEFGAITMMILAIAIISIVAISAKSRLSIMPKA